MSASPIETIARAVIRRDGQFLLARPRAKSWSFLPGGHIEPAERAEEALIREIAEELGTEAEITGFVCTLENIFVEDDIYHHEFNLVFEATIADADPVSKEENLEFHWLSLDSLAGADVRPETLKQILLATYSRTPPIRTPIAPDVGSVR